VDLPELIPTFAIPIGRAGIGYMVTGSVAAAIYGEPRLTRNVDLVVALRASDAGWLVGAFRTEDVQVRPTRIIDEFGRSLHPHFDILHLESGLRADVYLHGDDPLHAWAFERQREVRVAGEMISLAPPEYVILRKLEFFKRGGSSKHPRDIAWMLRVSESGIDRPLLERKVSELGLEVPWATALATPLDY